MMLLIKRIIFAVLGPGKYLGLVSTVFLFLYQKGLLKKKFPEHYFIRHLVGKGDTVIDIGANLGYYSIPLSHLCGKNGKVIAVEPVKLFVDILNKNRRFSPYDNIRIEHCALGSENDKLVQMGTPVRNGVLRHGLTKVITDENPDDFCLKYEIVQYHPEKIFGDLQKLKFIKCDVEGYERYIIPEFRNLIEKHRPVFQIEINQAEIKEILSRFFAELNYQILFLRSGFLNKPGETEPEGTGDFYFIPEESIENYRDIISPG